MTNISPPSNAVCPPEQVLANYGSTKWISWAPSYSDTLTFLARDCLTGPLQQLPLNRTTRNFVSGYCVLCEDVFDCIQDNLTLFDQASFSSSTVILGIGPALLSLVAPSVGELCMLAANRPLLSTLISLGAPSAFCFRPLSYDDPLDYLAPTNTVFTRQPLRPDSSGGRAYTIGILISLFEYILIGAASGNVVHASWLLGQQTILSWGCESSYRPFIWTMLSFAMQLISSQSYHFSNEMKAVRASERKDRAARGVTGGTALGRAIAAEVTPNAARRKRGFFDHKGISESRWIIFANIFAQLASLVLALYGTVTLSSLLLIGVRDSFYFTLRFFFSALACRGVLMFELSGMSAVENDNEAKRPGAYGPAEGQWVEL